MVRGLWSVVSGLWSVVSGHLKTGAICGAFSPHTAIDPTLAEPTFSRMRRSGLGGVAHACEYETAMMLYLRPDLVQMDRAVREIGQVN